MVVSRGVAGSANPKKQEGQYWAKGTGFGTGSTAQTWDVEQAFKRLEARERHLAALVRCLSAFIYPSAASSARNVACSVGEISGAVVTCPSLEAVNEGADGEEVTPVQTPTPPPSREEDGATACLASSPAAEQLLAEVSDILKRSCVREAIKSYLRNDSGESCFGHE